MTISVTVARPVNGGLSTVWEPFSIENGQYGDEGRRDDAAWPPNARAATT